MATVVLLLLATLQQSPAPDSQSPPEIVILGFNFETKSHSRLEPTQINSRAGSIPVGNVPFRAELGGEPVRGGQYLAYKRQTFRNRYATVTLRNSGTKAVKAIDWEYILPRFVKGKEVDAYRVRSKAKLQPGATLTLSSLVPRDDCSGTFLNARGVQWISGTCRLGGTRTTAWYRQGARLKRIRYADGSVWQAP